MAGKIDTSKMLKLYNKGVSQADIAKQFDVTRQAVNNALKPFKVKNPDLIQPFIDNRADILADKQITVLKELTPAKLKKADAKSLAVIFGVLHDKERLERDLSTSNIQSLTAIVKLACAQN